MRFRRPRRLPASDGSLVALNGLAPFWNGLSHMDGLDPSPSPRAETIHCRAVYPRAARSADPGARLLDGRLGGRPW